MRKFKPPLPDFSDLEVWQDLKRQCYDGTIEYEDFPADEYKYFDRLRITYLCYQYNHLSKVEAEQTERELRSEYEKSKEKDRQTFRIYSEYQENIRKSELLHAKLEKGKTLRDKLEAALEIIGLLVGDVDLKNRNLKNFKIRKNKK